MHQLPRMRGFDGNAKGGGTGWNRSHSFLGSWPTPTASKTWCFHQRTVSIAGVFREPPASDSGSQHVDGVNSEDSQGRIDVGSFQKRAI